MTTPRPDATHLLALITAAQEEAGRLGQPAAMIRERLEQAAQQARALEARGGAADQGLRLDELTTDNDR